MQTAIPCVMMRGGTSKGAYFLASDLPTDTAERDRVLLAVMGSPDPRQIDGIGGADPLTSKVAIISRSSQPGVDVDYLFAQVFVDKALVSTAQNCGNILAGVGPFAIQQDLVRQFESVPVAMPVWYIPWGGYGPAYGGGFESGSRGLGGGIGSLALGVQLTLDATPISPYLELSVAGLTHRATLGYSLATRFDSDHPDALVIQKRMEQANGVAAATNASDEQIGQTLFAVENLLSRFLADDALKITHYHRIRMGTEGAA